jgi:hypothetical protein
MKFGQRISIRKKIRSPEFARGLWSPARKEWRDVIETLITMSKRYSFNKLAMFKIQLWIASDVINESEAILKMRKKIVEIEQLKRNSNHEDKSYDNDIKHLKTEIESSKLTIAALREIIDGIVWRYFNYNRALLYTVADKQPIDIVGRDKGFKNSLNEFADVLINRGHNAILNDISNFLRIGDITNIKPDGSIEFIEVKSSKKKGARVKRQEERMQQTVEFFNTGRKELDNRKAIIRESSVKQKNYLSQLKDSILRARKVGYDSILIANHLIVETTDINKIDKIDKARLYFESKHKTVKDKWKSNDDKVYTGWSIEKLDAPKNYAPYTIFPFDDDIIADILMGIIWITYRLNNDEIIRILEKSGWKVVYSFYDSPENEIQNRDIEDIVLYKVRKDNLTASIPPLWIGRLCFELISPQVIVNVLEDYKYSEASPESLAVLSHYLDDENIWR